MPESDCPGSFQLPLAWAYNLTGDFCHFFCLDKRHFITGFLKEITEMNKYLATIITTFHNTDLRLFKSALESVRSQTIGINSIEWIVVVHNSEPGYLETVKEMAKDYDTIRVYELNNNCHTASSPRNFAL